MKLLLDTEKFNEGEYEALTDTLFEKELLEEFIRKVKSGEKVAPEDDLQILLSHTYNKKYYYYFDKKDRKLMLKILEILLVRINESIEKLIDHLGLERIEE